MAKPKRGIGVWEPYVLPVIRMQMIHPLIRCPASCLYAPFFLLISLLAAGYTTLACLAFKDVFSAGASHFGVADCELLAQETHKFESRYLDGLIGPYPEKKDVYKQRSPIHSIDNFKAPTILFQVSSLPKKCIQ